MTFFELLIDFNGDKKSLVIILDYLKQGLSKVVVGGNKKKKSELIQNNF